MSEFFSLFVLIKFSYPERSLKWLKLAGVKFSEGSSNEPVLSLFNGWFLFPLGWAKGLAMEQDMIKVLRKLQIPILASLLISFAPLGDAEAARACGERAKFAKHLNAKFKEQPQALGVLTKGNAIFEVFVSPEGSWTLLMTKADGDSCIMAAGHSWQSKDMVAFLPKS